MKKKLLFAVIGAMPLLMAAQGATDAYTLSQPDLKGTARFMSMAGAFGALGGDLSTLNQNPAGIGIYRSSEIGLTLNLDFQSTKGTSMGESDSWSQTKFSCPNFGYVGAVKLNSDVMPYFTWGASYSRVASFDRKYRGYIPQLSTSMSNYVANFTNGWATDELIQDKDYNPYMFSEAPWLSILGYNSYLINPVGLSNDHYNGLYKHSTTSDATFTVREKGYVDEFALDFGGNIMNTVYWGIGFGITDISYATDTYYDEELQNARIADASGNSTETGDAYFGLENFHHVSGYGFNFKAGVIIKPINEFRIGLAVHTPTYYDLRHKMYAVCDYSYSSGIEGWHETDDGYMSFYDSDLRTPWRLIASAAGVIGGKGIISLDYEYVDYNSMLVKDAYGDAYPDVTEDIENYYKASHIVRVGGEYRVTPQFSLRAGYSYQTSPAEKAAMDNDEYIYTSGTNPAYIFDNSIQYITAGIGYRYKAFSIDMAYVHKQRESTYRPFTSFDENYSPSASITDHNNQVVLSLGFKF